MEETSIKRFIKVVSIILYSLALIFSVLIGFGGESFWIFLISLVITWLILDIINVSASYIASGNNSINKSWLLRGYLMLFDNDTYNNLVSNENEEKVVKAYESVISKMMPELLKIISKEKLIAILKFSTAVDEQKENSSIKLNDLYDRTGKDEKFFESEESWNLDLETLKLQSELKRDFGQANLFYNLTAPLTADFVTISQKLEKGKIGLDDAFTQLHKNSDKRYKHFLKTIVPFSFWVATSNEILKIKESGKDMKNTKIETESLKKEANKYLEEQLSYAQGLVI